MKRFTKRIAVLLLSLTVLLTLASCTPVEDDSDFVDIVSDAVEWEVSEDGKTIVGGGKTYKRFSVEDIYKFDPIEEYEYYNEVNLPLDGYEYATLSSYAKSGDVIWADNGSGKVWIYATEEAIDSIEHFFYSAPKSFQLFEAEESLNYRSYPTLEDIDAFEELRKSGVTAMAVRVSDLRDAPCYTICTYDEYGVFRYACCAIYEYEDGLYYLNYLDLDNSYFDADGNFSYRSGAVTLTRLEEHVKETAEELINGMEYVPYTYTYEYDESDDYFEDDPVYNEITSVVLFWIAYALLGFAAPIPFLVFGYTFPKSERRGYPKYWYAVGIAATVWIVSAGVLMLFLIL